MPLFDDDTEGFDISSLLTDAAEPAGVDPTMAFGATLMKSPFYQGVPSQSGAGQISEAILPIVLGLMAEKQAEKQQKAAAAQQMLKTVLTLKQLAIQEEKLGGEREERKAKADQRTEAAKYWEQLRAGQGTGNLETTKISGKPGEMPTITMTDPTKKTGTDKLADAISGAFGTNITGNVFNQRKAAVQQGVYVSPRGTVEAVPQPQEINQSQQTIRESQPVYEAIGNLKRLAADPKLPGGGVGMSAMWSNIMGSARSQLAEMGVKPYADYLDKQIAPMEDAVASELKQRGELKPDPTWTKDRPEDDKAFTYAKWFPKGLARVNVLRNLVAYRVARILDPNGRLSDFDVQNAQALLTNMGFTPGVIGQMFENRQAFTESLGTVEDFVKSQEVRARDVNRRMQEMGGFLLGTDLGVTGAGPIAPTPGAAAPPPGAEGGRMSGMVSLDPTTVPAAEAVKILQQKFGLTDPAAIAAKLNEAGY